MVIAPTQDLSFCPPVFCSGHQKRCKDNAKEADSAWYSNYKTAKSSICWCQCPPSLLMIWPASLQFILWVPHIFSLTSSDSWSPWDCNNSHFQQTELLLNILIICESQYDVPGPISRMNTESKNQQIVMCKMLLFVTDSAYSVDWSQRKVNYEHLYCLQTVCPHAPQAIAKGATIHTFK